MVGRNAQRVPPGCERVSTTVRVAFFVVAGLVVGACAGGGSSVETSDRGVVEDGDTSSVTVPQVPASPTEDVPSALDDPDDDAFPDPLVDPAELLSGGPPPDGIPSIDDPRFVRAGDVDFLGESEPVLALTVGEETRAYPVQVLIWHEIANDTIDGVPVAVTYCPLCNSAIAYDRRLGDRVLEFGTSGQLFNSALVMYDRQTESLWSHFTGEAVIGHLTGDELDTFPVATVGWSDFRDANPDALVLSRDTGFERRYGTNPYPGYDDVGTAPFLFDGAIDDRLAAKERVIGVETAGGGVAVHLDRLLDDPVLEIANGDVVVWHLGGASSALDSNAIADGRDVGATGVFSPTVEGRNLEFRAVDDGFEDDETGSRWNILGQAITGPLQGTQLTAVDHVDTFWFAWAAFRPNAELVL